MLDPFGEIMESPALAITDRLQRGETGSWGAWTLVQDSNIPFNFDSYSIVFPSWSGLFTALCCFGEESFLLTTSFWKWAPPFSFLQVMNSAVDRSYKISHAVPHGQMYFQKVTSLFVRSTCQLICLKISLELCKSFKNYSASWLCSTSPIT